MVAAHEAATSHAMASPLPTLHRAVGRMMSTFGWRGKRRLSAPGLVEPPKREREPRRYVIVREATHAKVAHVAHALNVTMREAMDKLFTQDEINAMVARHICTVCDELWWRHGVNVGCACTRAIAEAKR